MMHKQQGLSLLEILVTIAIVTILIFTVKSSAIRAWDHWQVEQTASDVSHAWHTARTAALQNQQQTTLCGSSDAKHCDGNWQHFWLVKQGDNVLDIFQNHFLATKIQLQSNLPTKKVIAFSPEGDVKGQQGRFKLCHDDFCKKLIFIRSGRLRMG